MSSAAPSLATKPMGDATPAESFLSLVLWGGVVALVVSTLPLFWVLVVVLVAWAAKYAAIAVLLHRTLRLPLRYVDTPVEEAELPDDVRRAWDDTATGLRAAGYHEVARLRTTVNDASVWSSVWRAGGGPGWAQATVRADVGGGLEPGTADVVLVTPLTSGEVVGTTSSSVPLPLPPFGDPLLKVWLPAVGTVEELAAAHQRQVALALAVRPGVAPDTSLHTAEAFGEVAARQFARDVVESGYFQLTPEGTELMSTWRGAAAAALSQAVPGVDVPRLLRLPRARRAAAALGVSNGRGPAWAAAAAWMLAFVAGAALMAAAVALEYVVVTWAVIGMVGAYYYYCFGLGLPLLPRRLAAGGMVGTMGWAVASAALSSFGIRALLPRSANLGFVLAAAAGIAAVLLMGAALRGVNRAFAGSLQPLPA